MKHLEAVSWLTSYCGSVLAIGVAVVNVGLHKRLASWLLGWTNLFLFVFQWHKVDTEPGLMLTRLDHELIPRAFSKLKDYMDEFELLRCNLFSAFDQAPASFFDS